MVLDANISFSCDECKVLIKARINSSISSDNPIELYKKFSIENQKSPSYSSRGTAARGVQAMVAGYIFPLRTLPALLPNKLSFTINYQRRNIVV